MDCLKASKIKLRKVGCILFNTTHFARFDLSIALKQSIGPPVGVR